MDIWDADKLVLFIAFVIPGFIALKTYDLLVPGEARDSSQSIVEAIAYSCINYALFSWLLLLDTHLDLVTTAPIWHGIIIFIILFVAPIGLAVGFWSLRFTNVFRKYFKHPTPKPWDYVFGKQESFWIIVELNDGKRIGGIYDTASFASSFPMSEQIYLQEVWEVDGHRFLHPIDRSKGVIISEKDIRCINFYW
jgi:hypothetical protein